MHGVGLHVGYDVLNPGAEVGVADLHAKLKSSIAMVACESAMATLKSGEGDLHTKLGDGYLNEASTSGSDGGRAACTCGSPLVSPPRRRRSRLRPRMPSEVPTATGPLARVDLPLLARRVFDDLGSERERTACTD